MRPTQSIPILPVAASVSEWRRGVPLARSTSSGPRARRGLTLVATGRIQSENGMTSYTHLLAITLPVFALFALGVAVRRAQWLTEAAETSLLKLIVNLLYPCSS